MPLVARREVRIGQRRLALDGGDVHPIVADSNVRAVVQRRQCAEPRRDQKRLDPGLRHGAGERVVGVGQLQVPSRHLESAVAGYLAGNVERVRAGTVLRVVHVYRERGIVVELNRTVPATSEIGVVLAGHCRNHPSAGADVTRSLHAHRPRGVVVGKPHATAVVHGQGVCRRSLEVDLLEQQSRRTRHLEIARV